jgi:DNA (cytosine-5)-methyltransferase 1
MLIKIDKFKVLELMAKKKIKNQTELAKMLGISKNQLSNILSEKFSPIKSNVVELANFLGVSPLEIIEENKDNELHRK